MDAREADEKTLESKKRPGLFLAGEILDVQGPRGGYNLAWAWASGLVAGEEAAKDGRRSKLEAVGQLQQKDVPARRYQRSVRKGEAGSPCWLARLGTAI